MRASHRGRARRCCVTARISTATDSFRDSAQVSAPSCAGAVRRSATRAATGRGAGREVVDRVDAVRLARRDERVEAGQVLAGLVRSHEEEVLAPEGRDAKRALRGVVVDGQAWIGGGGECCDPLNRSAVTSQSEWLVRPESERGSTRRVVVRLLPTVRGLARRPPPAPGVLPKTHRTCCR
jgi:hypothetical protein